MAAHVSPRCSHTELKEAPIISAPRGGGSVPGTLRTGSHPRHRPTAARAAGAPRAVAFQPTTAVGSRRGHQREPRAGLRPDLRGFATPWPRSAAGRGLPYVVGVAVAPTDAYHRCSTPWLTSSPAGEEARRPRCCRSRTRRHAERRPRPPAVLRRVGWPGRDTAGHHADGPGECSHHVLRCPPAPPPGQGSTTIEPVQKGPAIDTVGATPPPQPTAPVCTGAARVPAAIKRGLDCRALRMRSPSPLPAVPPTRSPSSRTWRVEILDKRRSPLRYDEGEASRKSAIASSREYGYLWRARSGPVRSSVLRHPPSAMGDIGPINIILGSIGPTSAASSRDRTPLVRPVARSRRSRSAELVACRRRVARRQPPSASTEQGAGAEIKAPPQLATGAAATSASALTVSCRPVEALAATTCAICLACSTSCRDAGLVTLPKVAGHSRGGAVKIRGSPPGSHTPTPPSVQVCRRQERHFAGGGG